MIHGFITENPVLKAMYESGHEFHLTGSHYFGNPKEGSDIDFFVQDGHKVRYWLEDVGFEEVFTSGYENDLETTRVYRHLSGIDVQCVSDAEKKASIQKVFKRFHAESLAECKEDRNILWNTASQIWNAALAHQHNKDNS